MYSIINKHIKLFFKLIQDRGKSSSTKSLLKRERKKNIADLTKKKSQCVSDIHTSSTKNQTAAQINNHCPEDGKKAWSHLGRVNLLRPRGTKVFTEVII